SGFTDDATIYVELSEKDLTVTIINDSEKGSYIYDGKSYNEASKEVLIKTAQVIVLTIYPKTGFDLNGDNITFEMPSSVNTVTPKITASADKVYTIVLEGITSNGTLTINYKVREYEITFGYAEYDEENNIVIDANSEDINIVSVEQGESISDKKAGETVKAEHDSNLTVSSIYSKEGYEFFGFAKLVNGEYEIIANGMDGNSNSILINALEDLKLYLVFQRTEYTITYKVNNDLYGVVGLKTNYESDYNGTKEITQKVRYGRYTNAVIAKVMEGYADYITFTKWTDNIATISTEAELLAQEVKGDITYIAEFKANEYQFNVIIKADSPDYKISENVSSILGSQPYAYSAVEDKDESGNNIVRATITYTARQTIEFSLNINDYYSVYELGQVRENLAFKIEDITPQKYDANNNPFTITLKLKYYEVKLLVEKDFESAVIFSYSNSVGLDTLNSNFTPNGTTAAIAYVRYGSSLNIIMDLNYGYTFVEQKGDKTFVVNGKYLVMNDIAEKLEVTFIFAKTRYAVTFIANYPETCLGEVIEGYDKYQELGTYYIEQDEDTFKDINGNIADLGSADNPLSIKGAEEFAHKGIVYVFSGWSI
ncbi:MAG: hypothetical protein IJW25_02910, partial [Clostridia bacterium]|nr:hypothetical protein [Clostridia bacterium]